VDRPHLRKTKIIATVGPACDDEGVLRAMMEAGMNVARFNFSHGDHDQHLVRLERVRRVAAECGANVAVMLDTKGVEIRTGKLRDGKPVELRPGNAFELRTEPCIGDESGVFVTYPLLADDVRPGDRIFLDDGAMQLEVSAVDAQQGRIATTVVIGGRLKETKGVNLPDTFLALSPLSDTNMADLRFAAEQGVDYVAASFVRHAQDVHDIRAVLTRWGGRMPIIAKIENRAGVENLAEIVAAADGTMVARGDLGVEMPLAEVPAIQKRIIRATVTSGKPVITATQMLDSMERNPRPTRAESTDVANAIFDGTSAIMLSGETAIGAHPVLAVRTMAELAEQAERALGDFGHLQKILPSPANAVVEAVAQAAIAMASHLGAAAIVTLTETGFTTRAISKYRPAAPIIAVTLSEEIVRKFAMNWGVSAVHFPQGRAGDQPMIDAAIEWGRRHGYLRPGDRIVATAGLPHEPGSTRKIEVVEVR
jgi:pyruvate kinase